MLTTNCTRGATPILLNIDYQPVQSFDPSSRRTPLNLHPFPPPQIDYLVPSSDGAPCTGGAAARLRFLWPEHSWSELRVWSFKH
jgi:hypothetical protein